MICEISSQSVRNHAHCTLIEHVQLLHNSWLMILKFIVLFIVSRKPVMLEVRGVIIRLHKFLPQTLDAHKPLK